MGYVEILEAACSYGKGKHWTRRDGYKRDVCPACQPGTGPTGISALINLSLYCEGLDYDLLKKRLKTAWCRSPGFRRSARIDCNSQGCQEYVGY